MSLRWKYLKTINGFSVKHAFTDEMETIGICGKSPTWYNNEWYFDEEGLSHRRACLLCVRLIDDLKL